MSDRPQYKPKRSLRPVLRYTQKKETRQKPRYLEKTDKIDLMESKQTPKIQLTPEFKPQQSTPRTMSSVEKKVLSERLHQLLDSLSLFPQAILVSDDSQGSQSSGDKGQKANESTETETDSDTVVTQYPWVMELLEGE